MYDNVYRVLAWSWHTANGYYVARSILKVVIKVTAVVVVITRWFSPLYLIGAGCGRQSNLPLLLHVTLLSNSNGTFIQRGWWGNVPTLGITILCVCVSMREGERELEYSFLYSKCYSLEILIHSPPGNIHSLPRNHYS